MKICQDCQQAANRQAKLFQQGKTTMFDSYENIHALHQLVNARRKSIDKALTTLGIGR